MANVYSSTMHISSPNCRHILLIFFPSVVAFLLTACAAFGQTGTSPTSISCGNPAPANGTISGKAGTAVYLVNCTTGPSGQGYSANSAIVELGATVAGNLEIALYNANVTARLCTVAAGQPAIPGLNALPLTGRDCNDPANIANHGVGLAPNTTYKIAFAYSNPLDLRLTTAGSTCTLGASGSQFMQFAGYSSSPATTFPITSIGNQPWATQCAYRLFLNLSPISLATSGVAITVSPTATGLWTGAAQQFTAAVNGSTNTGVTWKTTGGSINSSGLYTAPQSVGTYTVTATSVADTSKSASAQATVMSPPGSVGITLSPSAASLQTGASQQFAASVTGTTNTSVSWTATGGTVTANGFYTAPQSAGTYTLTATSVADSTKSASAIVSVTTPPPVISITVSPTNASLQTGANQQFRASVAGTTDTAVTWSATGGTISSSGLYTAPQSAGTYTLTVTSVADPSKAASSLITVTAPLSVVVTSPTSGSIVSGTTTVSALASDNAVVASVQLRVDGATVGADSTSPYSFSLDTSTLSNGFHNLTAVAVDSSGKQATSSAVGIIVSNQSNGVTPAYANNGAGCPINTVPGGPQDLVTSYNCPLPNNTGSGNLLLMWVRYSNANSPTLSFTTNLGPLPATQAVSCVDNANNHTESGLYYAANVPAGIKVVTVNFSTFSSYVQLQPYEFYNVATTSPLDQAVCQVSSGSSISSSALPNLSASGDLVVNLGFADNGTAIPSCAPGSQPNIAWTMRAALIAGPEPMCFQYGTYNSTASFSPMMTFGTSVSYVSLSAAFKPANAGTPPGSGIRVAYVQHDDGYSQGASSLKFQLPISGNLAVEMTSAGCLSNTLSSCPYPSAFSDGANTWKLVSGSQYLSNTGSAQETVGSNWYASNISPGFYTLNVTQHRCTGGCAPFPDSYIMFDVVGASADPLDLGFGGVGNGLASISNTSSTSTPVTTFTATPSAANEVILAQAGYEWDTFTGLTSPSGAQFLSAYYSGETNYSWCDLNGGWGLFYNGSSTAPVTWTWLHDVSQYPGPGRGLALGVAFR
jgi:Bacterial Ig domain